MNNTEDRKILEKEINSLRNTLKVIHTWASMDAWSRQGRADAMKDICEHSKEALLPTKPTK
jgi:hypothetical protein